MFIQKHSEPYVKLRKINKQRITIESIIMTTNPPMNIGVGKCGGVARPMRLPPMIANPETADTPAVTLKLPSERPHVTQTMITKTSIMTTA